LSKNVVRSSIVNLQPGRSDSHYRVGRSALERIRTVSVQINFRELDEDAPGVWARENL
jgi:hypothetical protein